MNNLPRKGHCRHVMALLYGEPCFCHREVVEGTEFCPYHQPERPKTILTCGHCGKRSLLAGELLVPIAEETQ